MSLRAPLEERRRRMGVCKECPFATGPGDKKLFCGKCGCVLAGKVQLRGESCPAGKW